MNYKITDDNGTILPTFDADLSKNIIDDATIIDTAVIKEVDATKGVLISLNSKEGAVKLLTITSNTPLMVTLTDKGA